MQPDIQEKEEFKEADIVERISIDLSPEKEQELSAWITKKKEAINVDRNPWLERQKKYFFNFDDFLTYNRKGPWDGSANLHMPLTSISVKSIQSRLYNIFTQEDTVALIPREAMDDNQTEILKILRNWYIWDHINGYRGIKSVAYDLFHDVVTVGFGTLLKNWELKQRKAIMIEKRQQDELAREVMDLSKQAKELAEGQKLNVKPYREVQKIITVFEGTKLDTVPFENIWFPNHVQESSNLDLPELVVVSTTMTATEIALKGKQGLWSDERVKKALEESTQSASSDEQAVKELRDRLTGVSTQNSVYPSSTFDIEYAFCTYDVDDDGIAEELIVTRTAKGTVLSIIPLDRVSRSGMRPLVKFDCFSKPRQAYSRGVPEFLYPLQEEMDMSHNMRLDNLQLQVCPWGVYRGGSSLDDQQIRIAPGKFIKVDEIDDLKPLGFNANAQILGPEEDRLWKYSESMLSVSSLAQGIVPQQVGPTRSTSGVITLLQQMDKQFRPMVDQLAIQWRKLEYMILEDLDFRVDPQLKVRVLGPSVKDPDVLKAIALDLGQNYLLTKLMDLRIDVASIINSDEVKRNEATLILGQFLNPSLLQQSGIVSMKGMYKAVEDYLKAYGKNPDQYLDQPAFINQALTLWQEIQICAQGEVPPMSMTDNHTEKAEGLMAFLESPEYQEALGKGFYTKEIEQWIGRTVAKHEGLAQALQPKGQPNPTGEQGQDYSALMSASAPQQQQIGGPNVQSSGEAPAGAGNSEAVSSAGVGGSGGDRGSVAA